jgi:hypothetical protein
MPDSTPLRRPFFTAGDQVQVVGPTIHRLKRGVVIDFIPPSIDLVYRYRVRFSDGTVATFFGFELTIDGEERLTESA